MQALANLHETRTHRDLKRENVITSDWVDLMVQA